jgi:hypothetical protein
VFGEIIEACDHCEPQYLFQANNVNNASLLELTHTSLSYTLNNLELCLKKSWSGIGQVFGVASNPHL